MKSGGPVGLIEGVAIPLHHEINTWEARNSTPEMDEKDRVESHKLLPMRIAFPQTHLENGYEHLMDV
jgi:tripeptidyl-peptidase-1